MEGGRPWTGRLGSQALAGEGGTALERGFFHLKEYYEEFWEKG